MQSAFLCPKAMQIQCRDLCGHCARVTQLEWLLAQTAGATRANDLGELCTLRKDAWCHIRVVESVVAVQFLTSICPDATHHAIVCQELSNLRMVGQLRPLFMKHDLFQGGPKLLLGDLKGLRNCPVEVGYSVRRLRIGIAQRSRRFHGWPQCRLTAVSFDMNAETTPCGKQSETSIALGFAL